MNEAIRMQLSAFADGELPDNEAELLLRRMSQDAALRQEIAEYLAIGRLVRDEPGLAGADRLHERVAAALDDHEQPDVEEAGSSAVVASRAVRPLAGAAIAAAVALVAIFALQQNTGIDELNVSDPVAVASDVATIGGVPSIDAQQERQRQYFRSHAETSSELGANGMNTRVVTLRFSEELVEEPADDELNEKLNDSDETTETVTQP